MANVTLSQINTPDKNVQLIQANIQAALNQIQASPFQGGNLLTGVSLGTTQVAVPHKLGRTPSVYVICGLNAGAIVFNSAPSDSNNLYLTASAACVASVWAG